MTSAFIQLTPITSRTQVQGRALCSSTPSTTRIARNTVRMVAEKKKEEPLVDWLIGKFMHNAMWEGDEEIGYEPYWKQIETAREDEKKRVYGEMEKEE